MNVPIHGLTIHVEIVTSPLPPWEVAEMLRDLSAFSRLGDVPPDIIPEKVPEVVDKDAGQIDAKEA